MYKCALYEGSLAEPDDCNPYAGESPLLARLWLHGRMRMLRIRALSGPEIQCYLDARTREAKCEAQTDVEAPGLPRNTNQ